SVVNITSRTRPRTRLARTARLTLPASRPRPRRGPGEGRPFRASAAGGRAPSIGATERRRIPARHAFRGDADRHAFRGTLSKHVAAEGRALLFGRQGDLGPAIHSVLQSRPGGSSFAPRAAYFFALLLPALYPSLWCTAQSRHCNV